MSPVQNFSFHTHNNALGIFDGKNTAIEMLRQAEALGWEAIGVSNHLAWHPNCPASHPMFFSDYDKALDVYKRSLNVLREAASQVKIKVFAGFEVDFFASAEWRHSFEKMRRELDIDYLIGSQHFLQTPDEKLICNIFRLNALPAGITPEEIKELVRGYWNCLIQSIRSGYFDFIAHPGYVTHCGYGAEPEWDDYRWKVIEALADTATPCELNTGGYNKQDQPFPLCWMIEEMNRRNVPLVISDDAHKTSALGQFFDRAEDYLASINYQNRWCLKF